MNELRSVVATVCCMCVLKYKKD